jgi:hypothetical protein
MQQSYPDRMMQAELGRARLSLATGPSRYFQCVPSTKDND